MASGKRYKAARAAIDAEKQHSIDEAVTLVKANAKTKFDETIDISVNLGVDPKYADQMVRGVCNLPSGTGRDVRVAVFARDAKAEEATAAGADIVGAEDLMEKIQGGFMDFDRVIATPDMMAIVGRLGKVLGPRGLMPSPRAGTVTQDVETAVKEYKAGKVEFRVDAGGNVHCVVGKLSFDDKQLLENTEALLQYIQVLKPSAAKGVYVRKICISATMSPGIIVAA